MRPEGVAMHEDLPSDSPRVRSKTPRPEQTPGHLAKDFPSLLGSGCVPTVLQVHPSSQDPPANDGFICSGTNTGVTQFNVNFTVEWRASASGFKRCRGSETVDG